jgi:hypothetical protein
MSLGNHFHPELAMQFFTWANNESLYSLVDLISRERLIIGLPQKLEGKLFAETPFLISAEEWHFGFGIGAFCAAASQFFIV